MSGITVAKAQALWRQVLHGRHREVEILPIHQTRGRILARDVVTSMPIPSFNKSAMDGFAIHSQEGLQTYEVLGTIGAGIVWNRPVRAGQAVRIMTGAPVPADCDTVVMQEQCDFVEGSTSMTTQGHVQVGRHIISAGEECSAGTQVLTKGQVIDTGLQTVLAGLGYQKVPVYKSVKALLLTSGREIVEPGQNLVPGTVYNSNRFMLEGLMRDAGLTEIRQYHVTDDPACLENEIAHVVDLAQDCDLIVSSGGVSVGLFDSMPAMYEALGAKVLYHRIQMRPGAASYGAITDGGTLIMGLSGNPVAAYNGWHLLVKEAVCLLQGRTVTRKDFYHQDKPSLSDQEVQGGLSVVTDERLTKKPGLPRYVQGRVRLVDGQLHFSMIPNSGGSALLALAYVNAIAMMDTHQQSIEKGQRVRIFITKPVESIEFMI